MYSLEQKNSWNSPPDVAWEFLAWDSAERCIALLLPATQGQEPW